MARAQALCGRWITYSGPQRQIWTLDSRGHFSLEVGGSRVQVELDASWRVVDDYIEIDWDGSPESPWAILADPEYWHWRAFGEWLSTQPPRFKIESLSDNKVVMQDVSGSSLVLDRDSDFNQNRD